MSFTVTMPIDKDPLKGSLITDWAKKYCRSYITNRPEIASGNLCYVYYFSEEVDCTFFKLTWS